MTPTLAASAGFALLYGAAFCWREKSGIASLIKTLPLALMAVHFALAGAPVLLVVALGLGAAGDLALSRHGVRMFLLGLKSFALAHLIYIVLFLQDMAEMPGFETVMVILFALSTWIWLLPHTGVMRGAVTVYVALIAAMAIAAFGMDGAPLVTLGALAFLASDTLLAVQLFRLPDDSALHRPLSVILWTLYYGGQLMIGLALTR